MRNGWFLASLIFIALALSFRADAWLLPTALCAFVGIHKASRHGR